MGRQRLVLQKIHPDIFSVFRNKMAPSCLLTVSKSSQKQLCLTRLRKSSHCHELKPSSVKLGVLVCQLKNLEPLVPEGGEAEQSWQESVQRNLLPKSSGGKSALSQSQAWMGKSLLFLLTSQEGGRLFFQPQTPESPPWSLYTQPTGHWLSLGLGKGALSEFFTSGFPNPNTGPRQKAILSIFAKGAL